MKDVSGKPAIALLVVLGLSAWGGGESTAEAPLDIDSSSLHLAESREMPLQHVPHEEERLLPPLNATVSISGFDEADGTAASLVIQPHNTTVQLLDAHDPRQLIWKLALDGRLRASRLIGDTLYLVSDGAKPTLASTDGCVVDPHIAVNDRYTDLLVISAVNLRTRRVTDVDCLSTNISGVHISAHSLYIAGSGYRPDGDEPITVVHKFAIQGGEVSYRATGAVSGALSWNDPSSFMDEHEGDLRIFTSYRSAHRLSVLRESTGQSLLLVSTMPNASPPAAIGELEGVLVTDEAGSASTFPARARAERAVLDGDGASALPGGRFLSSRWQDLAVPPGQP